MGIISKVIFKKDGYRCVINSEHPCAISDDVTKGIFGRSRKVRMQRDVYVGVLCHNISF